MLGRLFRKRPPTPPAPRPGTASVTLATIIGDTMGTTYEVKVGVAPGAEAEALAGAVHAAVTEVDQQMSTWKTTSDLSRFNDAPPGDWVAVPEDLARVVDAGLAISRATQGAFDMTVGSAVDGWGFGPRGPVSAPPGPMPKGRWQALEARISPPALRKTAALRVDLSGIAKGFGVDRICGVLKDHGATDFLVSIDGEVRASGRNPAGRAPWHVAIETPDDETRAPWDVIDLADRAMATSGDYRHFFHHDGRRYAHTIDPATGAPLETALASVSVMMPDCMSADAWATALMVMGEKRAPAIAEARNIDALFLLRTAEGLREIVVGDFAAGMPFPTPY